MSVKKNNKKKTSHNKIRAFLVFEMKNCLKMKTLKEITYFINYSPPATHNSDLVNFESWLGLPTLFTEGVEVRRGPIALHQRRSLLKRVVGPDVFLQPSACERHGSPVKENQLMNLTLPPDASAPLPSSRLTKLCSKYCGITFSFRKVNVHAWRRFQYFTSLPRNTASMQ